MNNRLLWIDLLNILACFGVLFLHCSNGPVHNFDGNISVAWGIGLFSHGFFIWPVNVFFMLSGYTLIRKSILSDDLEGVKQFYKRRLRRLLIPVLFWNVFYTITKVLTQYFRGETVDDGLTIARTFFSFQYDPFLGFFIPLIIIYLSFPFLAVFVLNAGQKLLRLFLIISIVLGAISNIASLIDILPNYTNDESVLDIYLFGTRFLMIVVAGYYLGNYDVSKATRRILYISACICMILMSLGTGFLNLYLPDKFTFFNSYTNLPCVITSFAIFTFFKYHDWEKMCKKLHMTAQLFAKISSLSLGVYLIQYFWFKVFFTLHLTDISPILRIVIMYFLCLSSVWMIKKIPYIRNVV